MSEATDRKILRFKGHWVSKVNNNNNNNKNECHSNIIVDKLQGCSKVNVDLYSA